MRSDAGRATFPLAAGRSTRLRMMDRISASLARSLCAFGLLGAVAIAGSLSGCAGPRPAAEAEPTADRSATSAAVGETVVYLVRHAEKRSDQGDDPELTAAGDARAEALATRLADEGIDSIFATQYRRTQLTVAPLARRLGQEIEVVDAIAVAELAETILSEPRGESILVCAHSNTLPQLLQELGSAEKIVIPDDRYGDLFLLRIAGDATSLERRRVGD